MSMSTDLGKILLVFYISFYVIFSTGCSARTQGTLMESLVLFCKDRQGVSCVSHINEQVTCRDGYKAPFEEARAYALQGYKRDE